MVFKERCATVEDVRPGRKLFVHQVSVGNELEESSFQLVFIHGICGSEMQFHSLLHCLDQVLSAINVSISCLLFDCVGCGKSPILDQWDAYSFDEVIEDLAVLMNKYLDKNIPTIAVGHSFGTNIFLPLFRRQKQHHGQFTINLVGTVFLSSSLEFKSIGPVIFALPVPFLKRLQHTLTEEFIKMAINPGKKELIEAVRSASNSNNMFVVKAYNRHAKWCTPDDLHAIMDLPALIVHGAHDKLIPLQNSERLESLIPRSKLVVIDNASHMIMLEEPEAVATAILSFLQKLKIAESA